MSLASAIGGFLEERVSLEELVGALMATEVFYLLGEGDEEQNQRVMPCLVKVEGAAMGVLLSEPAAAVQAGERLGLFDEGGQVHAMEIPRDHLFPILQAAGASGLVFNLGREEEEAVIGPEVFAFLAAESALGDLAGLPALHAWVIPGEKGPSLHVRLSAEGRELAPLFSREDFAHAYARGLIAARDHLPPEDRTPLELEAEGAKPLPIPLAHLVESLLGSSALGVLLDPGQPTALLLGRGQLEKLMRNLSGPT